MNHNTLAGSEAHHRVDAPEESASTSTEARPRQIVYIVDDDSACRSSIVRLIESFGYEALSFSSAEEFLQYDRPTGEAVAECAIVDYSLTGMSGLELQEALQQRGLKMPLIFMSGVAPFATAAEAVRRGARALLEKPIRGVILQTALQNAFAHHQAPSAARHEEGFMEKVRLVHRLSPREREVAQLVAQGLSNKEIAVQLKLSEKTIEKYRSNCVKKLLAKSSTEMVRTVVMAEMLGMD